MRGYFGIGVEGVSKPTNLGAVTRTAHAFGASFVFTVSKSISMNQVNLTDTSNASLNIPFYEFNTPDDLILPKECSLIGVEITEDSIQLPSFHHPRCASYIFGPERGMLSDNIQHRCDYIVKIPTKFSINLGIAAALIMYDRLISNNRFSPRPHRPGGSSESLPEPIFGEPTWVRKKRRREKINKDIDAVVGCSNSNKGSR